jgi:iron complex transport system permease protein
VRRLPVLLSLQMGLLIALCLVSLGTGVVDISPLKVAGIIADKLLQQANPEDIHTTIVWDIRLPRVLLAILVGAALAISGAAMQGFFRNPMADPYIIGVSSGAALGATIALSFGLEFWLWRFNALSLFAFGGALAVTFTVYLIASRNGKMAPTVVLLTGVGLGALAAALTSYLMLYSESDLHRILYWLMGGLANRRWEHVQMIWPYVLIGCTVLFFFSRELNLLLQGEEQARYLGVEVERVKRQLLVISALLTAAAVAVSGIIGFVGLVVPHVMRLLVGPDHRALFPASLLGGAILLVGADTAARVLIAPAELPIGVLTALLGGPFFLYLLGRWRDEL